MLHKLASTFASLLHNHYVLAVVCDEVSRSIKDLEFHLQIIVTVVHLLLVLLLSLVFLVGRLKLLSTSLLTFI